MHLQQSSASFHNFFCQLKSFVKGFALEIVNILWLFILYQLKTMASESPQTDEMSNQEDGHPTDPSDNNSQDEDIDPNAPTQYIENDNSNENQVSF